MAADLPGPKIVPWLELNVSDDTSVNYAAAGLLAWQAVTDTAIVSTEPGHEKIYPMLRQRVPGMRIIPGLKTSPLLGSARFDNLVGWEKVALATQKVLVAAQENTIVLENETAMYNYIKGWSWISQSRLAGGLAKLPPAKYLWYPSAAMSGATLNRYLAVDRTVEQALNVQFIDHASLYSPKYVGTSGAVNCARQLDAVATEPTLPLIYAINYDPFWLDWQVPQAVDYVERTWGPQSWAIVYTGWNHWVAGAKAISKFLLAAS